MSRGALISLLYQILPRLLVPLLLLAVVRVLWRGTARVTTRPLVRAVAILVGTLLVGLSIFLAAWSWGSGS